MSMRTSPSGCVAHLVAWCGVGARFPFAQKHAEHETNSPVKQIPCCFAVACSTLAWAWAKGICKWLMSISLPCFSSPGVRAATARGVSILQSDLEGIFPANLISPNTEPRGGKGVGSSTVTAPKTFESCLPVAHMFFGGGFPAAKVERGVATALEGWLHACLVPLVSLLQFRREAG